jgi:uncharacterized hydrophobic protein (TIGR00271 family)
LLDKLTTTENTGAAMTRESIRYSAWQRIKATFLRFTPEWQKLHESIIAPEQIVKEVLASSYPTINFFALLGLSCAIATFGLLANSAPAIIGAMIIAPLMTPIMGLSGGIVRVSWKQILRSAITIFLGVSVVIVISFLCARIIGINVVGTEMLSRAFPSLLDLGVAMAAGTAGAYSMSRESIRNSIAGVAISVSLVPPLAVVGIGLALGSKATAEVGLSFREVGLFAGGNDIAVGAFVLFLTNLAAIVVCAGLVMAIQGYASWKRAAFGLGCALLVSIVLMQPLYEQFERLRVRSMVLRLVKTMPVTHPHIFESTVKFATLRVRDEDDVIHVSVEGTIPSDKVEGLPARLELFRHELEKKVGEPIIIEIEAIPIDVVLVRSAPDGDKDKGVQSSPTVGK